MSASQSEISTIGELKAEHVPLDKDGDAFLVPRHTTRQKHTKIVSLRFLTEMSEFGPNCPTTSARTPPRKREAPTLSELLNMESTPLLM